MKLKVMNFNICCGDDPGGNTIAERAPRIGKIIKKYDPDIIGLQEYTPNWAPFITETIGSSYEIFNKLVLDNLGTDLSEKIYKIIDDRLGISKDEL